MECERAKDEGCSEVSATMRARVGGKVIMQWLKKRENLVIGIGCIVVLLVVLKGVMYWDACRCDEELSIVAADMTAIRNDMQVQLEQLDKTNKSSVGKRMQEHSAKVKELIRKNNRLEEKAFAVNRSKVRSVGELLWQKESVLALIETACLDEMKVKKGDSDNLVM